MTGRRKPIDRLQRLLALLPYLRRNPGIDKPTVAREFGISIAQLDDDLNTLWLCGLPAGGGGDLIDLQFEGDTVTVTDSQGIDRPLRLTSAEASVLLLALQFLAEQDSSIDPSALFSAMAKIEQAASAGGQSAAATLPRPEQAGSGRTAALPAVREAIGGGRALRMRYYTDSRDAVTDRIVDPIRIVVVGSSSYLHAWCRTAGGPRMFRLDRIDRAEVLDEPSNPPETPQVDALSDFYTADAGLPQVRLAVSADHRWVLDYFPMVLQAEHADGSAEVTMRYATESWLMRIVTGFGGALRILDDGRLCSMTHARAAEALRVYGLSAEVTGTT